MSTQEKLETLIRASQAFQEQPAEMEALWNSCSCPLYSLEDRQKQLGLGDKVWNPRRPRMITALFVDDFVFMYCKYLSLLGNYYLLLRKLQFGGC